MQNFSVSAVGRLEIAPGAFANFPKTGRAVLSEVIIIIIIILFNN